MRLRLLAVVSAGLHAALAADLIPLKNVQLRPLSDAPSQAYPSGLCVTVGNSTDALQSNDPVVVAECSEPKDERQLFRTTPEGRGLIARVQGTDWVVATNENIPRQAHDLRIFPFTGTLTIVQDFASIVETGPTGTHNRFRFIGEGDVTDTPCINVWGGSQHVPGGTVGTWTCTISTENTNFEVLQGPNDAPPAPTTSAPTTSAATTDSNAEQPLSSAAAPIETAQTPASSSPSPPTVTATTASPLQGNQSSSSPGQANNVLPVSGKPIALSPGMQTTTAIPGNSTMTNNNNNNNSSTKGPSKAVIIALAVLGSVLFSTILTICLVALWRKRHQRQAALANIKALEVYHSRAWDASREFRPVAGPYDSSHNLNDAQQSAIASDRGSVYAEVSEQLSVAIQPNDETNFVSKVTPKPREYENIADVKKGLDITTNGIEIFPPAYSEMPKSASTALQPEKKRIK